MPATIRPPATPNGPPIVSTTAEAVAFIQQAVNAYAATVQQVAGQIGADPTEVIATAKEASEVASAINMAIAYRDDKTIQIEVG